MDIFNHPPKFIKVLFPWIIWDLESNGILLTIDDGPSENTDKLLDQLDRHNIKAVFFCTGRNIEKYHFSFQNMIKRGHVIGNHGYDHKQLIFGSKSSNFKSLKRSDDIIKKVTGESPKLVRPPYGRFNHQTVRALKKLDGTMMLWSLLTGDHTGDFLHVRRLVDSYLKNSSIIVMHDNKKSMEIFSESLEYIVQICKDREISIIDPNFLKFD
ncbi:MAG: polysaccharide deacetylase family protein [Candidatus Delongbacteria bacterium]|nr:polysaccharide deacetylase family protein [Candidatus Delongbacteria bacterium]